MITRVVTYLVVVVLTTTCFWWAQPSLSYDARGVLLPIASSRPAILAVDVRLLPFTPARYTALGQINIEQHFKANEQYQRLAAKSAERYAKELASEVGANAIIITSFGPAAFVENNAESAFYVFRGTAIHYDEANL